MDAQRRLRLGLRLRHREPKTERRLCVRALDERHANRHEGNANRLPSVDPFPKSLAGTNTDAVTLATSDTHRDVDSVCHSDPAANPVGHANPEPSSDSVNVARTDVDPADDSNGRKSHSAAPNTDSTTATSTATSTATTTTTATATTAAAGPLTSSSARDDTCRGADWCPRITCVSGGHESAR